MHITYMYVHVAKCTLFVIKNKLLFSENNNNFVMTNVQGVLGKIVEIIQDIKHKSSILVSFMCSELIKIFINVRTKWIKSKAIEYLLYLEIFTFY